MAFSTRTQAGSPPATSLYGSPCPATASVDLFDPTTGLFAATVEPLSQARSHHTVTMMTNGRILFFGGRGPSSPLTTELSKIMN
jgi:hypothetical protein